MDQTNGQTFTQITPCLGPVWEFDSMTLLSFQFGPSRQASSFRMQFSPYVHQALLHQLIAVDLWQLISTILWVGRLTALGPCDQLFRFFRSPSWFRWHPPHPSCLRCSFLWPWPFSPSSPWGILARRGPQHVSALAIRWSSYRDTSIAVDLGAIPTPGKLWCWGLGIVWSALSAMKKSCKYIDSHCSDGSILHVVYGIPCKLCI